MSNPSNEQKTRDKIDSIVEAIALLDIQLARTDLTDEQMDKFVESKTQLAIDMSIANEYMDNNVDASDIPEVEQYFANLVITPIKKQEDSGNMITDNMTTEELLRTGNYYNNIGHLTESEWDNKLGLRRKIVKLKASPMSTDPIEELRKNPSWGRDSKERLNGPGCAWWTKH
jgi:hypothetical protein